MGCFLWEQDIANRPVVGWLHDETAVVHGSSQFACSRGSRGCHGGARSHGGTLLCCMSCVSSGDC
eukprot:3951831-Amphidinium_carterae.1